MSILEEFINEAPGGLLGILILLYYVFRVLIPKMREPVENKYQNGLPSMQVCEYRTVLIEDADACQIACDELCSETSDKILGFDCEWVNKKSGQRPVALLQIATSAGSCYLYRLNLLKKIPPCLANILKDGAFIKAGVCPLNDGLLLLKDYKQEVSGTLDLRFLYPECTGLASLAKTVLDVKLSKDSTIILSNWEEPILTPAQIEYAAKDAIVAVAILKKWISRSITNQWKTEILKFVDVPFQVKKPKMIKGLISEGMIPNPVRGYEVRQSPLYDNCYMNGPDGKLLCSCNRRKAQWYIDRGLAVKVSSEPFVINLLFNPAARGDESDTGKFYRQLKQNCCVVCGNSESYLRHYVVPREYRRHFPAFMKDHQSHDVVLMCVSCHYLACHHNEKLKKKLQIICEAPVHKQLEKTEMKILKKIRGYAKAIMSVDKNIPEWRKLELQYEIKKFFDVDDLTPEILQQAVKIEVVIQHSVAESHGLRVVQYYNTEGGGLENLELLWRNHFLDTMKPNYLPSLWSPHHNHSWWSR